MSLQSSNNTVQKPLRKAIAWLLGLSLVVWSTGIVCGHLALRLDFNEPKVLRLFKLEDLARDIVYIGDSVTNQAINPKVIQREIGLTGFNLANGGASFLENMLVLDTYLSRNQSPKLVVLGIQLNRAASGDGIRPSVYLSLSSDRQRRYRKCAQILNHPFPLSERILMRLPAYRFRSSIERLVKYPVQGKGRLPRFIDGHLALDYSVSPPKSMPPYRSSIRPNSLSTFLDFCQQKQLPVLITEIACCNALNEATLGRDETLTALHQLLCNYPNAGFVSLNSPDEIGLTETDWTVFDHLNESGAIKFSNSLAPIISAHLQSPESP